MSGLLREWFALERAVQVQDERGRLQESWSTLATVPGRVAPTRVGAIAASLTADQLRAQAWYRAIVRTPVGVDIRLNDRLRDQAGVAYRVIQRTPQAERDMWMVYLQREGLA